MYLIAAIHPADCRDPEAKPVALLSVRRPARKGDPHPGEMFGLAEDSGWTFHPHLGLATTKRGDGWDWTASVYTSPSKDGVGRCGSMLYLIPCRPMHPEGA